MIGAIESYQAYRDGSGGNLTPMQRRYAELRPQLIRIQQGRLQPRAMVLAFGDVGLFTRGIKAKLPERPLRISGSVRLLAMLPIPSEMIPGSVRPGHERRYRLHFMDSGATVVGDDMYFGGPAAGRSKYFQADLAKAPLQDHQCYDEHRGTPDADVSLATPVRGSLAITSDEMFFRIAVNGDDIYRFDLADKQLVEMLKTSGEVAVGEEVARIHGDVAYLAAKFERSRPILDIIQGDVLPASRRESHFEFSVAALEKIFDHAGGSLRISQSVEECLPQHLLQFSEATLTERRSRGWQPNATFQQRLLWAVSPDAVDSPEGLVVRSPVTGVLQDVQRETYYKRLVFAVSNGAQRTVILPLCAELNVDKVPGVDLEVTQGQVLGDYAPRAYYSSYEQLTEVADGSIVKLEDCFFDSLLVRPGTNWEGPGVAIDSRFVGESLRQAAIGDWFDFSGMESLFDEEMGLYVTPALPCDALQQGLQHRINGVTYDFHPQGKRFYDEAPRPRRRRAFSR